MIVSLADEGGAHAARHQHPHEQIFWMISGRMEFDLDGEKRVVPRGRLRGCPRQYAHEAYFPEDTEVISTSSPHRASDMFTGEDSYLRRG